MTPRTTAYLVVRFSYSTDAWDMRVPALHEDFHYQPFEDTDGGPVQVPEAVFLDRHLAQHDRMLRESAARELLNPFWFSSGYLPDLTTVSERTFREQLAGLGLPAPAESLLQAAGSIDWIAWWDRKSPYWSAEQRAGVWNMLDKVQLFDVIEIELE